MYALNSTGRAGSGADAAALRAEGHVEMPFRHDIRSGHRARLRRRLVALHERFGTSAAVAVARNPPIDLADDGFPASPLLVGPLPEPTSGASENLAELLSQLTRPGARVADPASARALTAVADRRTRRASTWASSATG